MCVCVCVCVSLGLVLPVWHKGVEGWLGEVGPWVGRLEGGINVVCARMVRPLTGPV